jgi:hypothetical protein
MWNFGGVRREEVAKSRRLTGSDGLAARRDIAKAERGGVVHTSTGASVREQRILV